jgi:esterase FrsA
VAWVLAQPAVDRNRFALIGASIGGYVVLRQAAADPRVRAVVALCPAVNPAALTFSGPVAEHFATMLAGISGSDLQALWAGLHPLTEEVALLSDRPLLLVTGDHDELFPPSHYTDFVAALPSAEWRRHPEADHAFCASRPWLVETVTDWLEARFGPTPAPER